MKYALMGIALVMAVFISVPAQSAGIPISDSTAECIDCHSSIHPGIVKDWQKSRHAQTTPKAAMAVEGLARKVSAKNVSEELQNAAVGCAECAAEVVTRFWLDGGNADGAANGVAPE